MRNWLFVAFLLLIVGLAFPQDSQESPEGTDQDSGPDFSLGLALGLGVQSYPEGAGGVPATYQYLALRPDIGIGKFGIGLDFGINYRFDGGDGNDFRVRKEDWVPTNDRSFLEIYLAKIAYLRWAQKGDPLYIRLGSLDNATLGNGYIVGGYANTLFLPDLRLVGLQLDLDGVLFGAPLLGVETLVGNLAVMDVLAGRLFVRPLAPMEVPILSALQVGTTYAMDRDPYYYADKNENFVGPVDNDAEVLIWGVDLRLPLLDSDVISLATFGDYVLQEEAPGGMVGFGGRLLGHLLYGGQIRYLGENFIPVYFDSSYDLFRLEQYEVYDADTRVTAPYWGWLATLGFAFFEDSLVFQSSVEGPIGPGTGVNPTLRGSVYVGPQLLAGFTVDGEYVKRDISDFEDLTSPEDALIQMRFGYQTGITRISLVYRLRYDPFADGDPWQVSSGLESTIVLQ